MKRLSFIAVWLWQYVLLAIIRPGGISYYLQLSGKGIANRPHTKSVIKSRGGVT